MYKNIYKLSSIENFVEKLFLNKRYLYDGKELIYLKKIQRDKIREFENRYNIKNRKENICYICNKRQFIKICEKDKYGFYYPVLVCKNCGLVQVNPYYTEEEIKIFYSDYYREIYMGRKESIKRDINIDQKRGFKVIKLIEDNTKIKIRNKKILDVGCGKGGILMEFKKRNNECIGIDINKDYFNTGLKNNLNLLQISLKDFLKVNKNRKFDIIIFSHNLEHLLNPNEDLRNLKRIIHKNTLIYVSVPGIYNMKNHNYDLVGEFFQNAHKTHFSLNTLSNLMSKHSFKLIYGNEKIESIFKFESKKIKIRLENYKIIIKKLRNIEKKYQEIIYKLKVIKISYFILDMLKIRNVFLEILKKLKLTKFLRNFFLK